MTLYKQGTESNLFRKKKLTLVDRVLRDFNE